MNHASRAALYVRQSISNEEGIQRQLGRCRSLANARGYEIVAEYRDNDVSATSGVRPEWQKLLAAFRNNEVAVVVAVNMDRLLRSVGDLALLLDVGALVLTVEGDLDLTTSDGEFRASLFASLARFEVARKSERQIRANETRHAAGRALPARRRYGYQKGNKQLHPDEAPVVRRMFDEFLSGRSLRSIIRGLNAEGLTPTTGSAKEWSQTRLRLTLSNAGYAGYSVRHGVEVPSDEIERIVSPEELAEARARLAEEKRGQRPGPKHVHLLSGILRCGGCGDGMAYSRRYQCRGGDGQAGHTSISKAQIEPLVYAETARTLCAAAGDLLQQQPTGTLAPLVKQREAVAQRVRQTLDDRDEGLIPADLARERLLELRNARLEIEAKLDQARLASTDSERLEALARDLLTGSDGEVIPMERFNEAQAQVEAALRELPLDAQRSVISALLEIHILPAGKKRNAAARTVFTHPRTPWLDADRDAEADLRRQVDD